MNTAANYHERSNSCVMPAKAGIYPDYRSCNQLGIDPSLRWGDEYRPTRWG